MADKIIRVIHEPSEQEPFAVIWKPAGLPSAPLKENDDCALNQALKLFPEIGAVKGKKEIEKGLLHRIDTDTQGLLLIASSQTFYTHMMIQQDAGLFKKGYKAVCTRNSADSSYPPEEIKLETLLSSLQKYTVSSRFRPFGTGNKEVRPVSDKSPRAALKKACEKLYSTTVAVRKSGNDFYEADCYLTKGYRHQVRSHLAWLGLPIYGDRLYNPCYEESQAFKFAAVSLEFTDLNGKIHHFETEPEF